MRRFEAWARWGPSHIGRVISWNGVASYGALAVGAPLGVWLHHLGGLGLLSAVIILIAGVAIGFALPRSTVKTLAGKKIPFSAAFVGTRLLFPNSINRYGGLLVSLVCYTVEIIGLLLVWLAPSPFTAQLGALLTGTGFSLVSPALGIVAMKQVPAQNQGSALATFTAFMDLALGIVGPLAGMLMARAGAASIYLAAALLVFAGLLMTLSLRRRQRGAKNPYRQVGGEKDERKAKRAPGRGEAKNRYRQLHQVIT